MLGNRIGNDKPKLMRIKELTHKAMSGEISFRAALDERMRIALPTKFDVETFAKENCPSLFTHGVEDLVGTLLGRKKDVFILSGGFRDLIIPFATHLGIPDDNVFAVEVKWDEDTGVCLGIDDERSNGFATSKLGGAKRIALKRFSKNSSVVVGDGYTDYELYRGGIASNFVAYTEHVRRQAVIDVAPYCAESIADLERLL